MPRNGTFCLARVIKSGFADSEMVSRVILNPEIVPYGKTRWTILDGEQFRSIDKIPFFYGKLAKYHPETDLSIANPEKKKEESKSESNLIAAKSPFIYIPSMSGIAFLNVPNQIERNKFFRIFAHVYNETINELLNSIELETINDLRRFYEKIQSLDKIVSIKSKVYPPNPLYGILWKRLKEFLESRNTSSLDLNEQGKETGINSDLKIIVEAIVGQHIDKLLAEGFVPSITDAAIIMATDGYGHGTITGTEDGKLIPIHTYETTRTFKMPTDSEAHEIFNIAYAILKKVELERRMEHPDDD